MSLREKVRDAIWECGVSHAPEEVGRITNAVMAVLRPVDAVADAKPVIVYFETEADREEFIAAVLEVKPGMRSVRVD